MHFSVEESWLVKERPKERPYKMALATAEPELSTVARTAQSIVSCCVPAIVSRHDRYKPSLSRAQRPLNTASFRTGSQWPILRTSSSSHFPSHSGNVLFNEELIQDKTKIHWMVMGSSTSLLLTAGELACIKIIIYSWKNNTQMYGRRTISPS